MHIYTRRLLAGFFILLFFVIVPPLILITEGYLYNIKKNKFEKTALLIIDSDPGGAEILLNNNPPRNWWINYLPFLNRKQYLTPARINYILPSEYDLTVKREGFHSWNARLKLTGGTTQFIEKIKLWPDELPVLAKDVPSTFISLAPSANYIARISMENIFSLEELNDNQPLFSLPLADRLDSISWRPDGRSAIIKQNEKYFLALSGSQNLIPANIPLTTAKLQWSANYPTHIYGEITGGIIDYDTDRQKYNLFYPYPQDLSRFKDWVIFKDNLWGITPDTLVRANTDTANVTTWSIENGASFKKILYQDKNIIYIITNKNELLRWHKNAEQWQKVFANQPITHLQADVKTNSALWGNDFEIGIINLETLENRLITRFSQPIISIISLDDSDNFHHLIITQNKIQALDIQSPDQPIITDLFTLPGITSARINAEEKELIILTQDDDETVKVWRYPINQ